MIRPYTNRKSMPRGSSGGLKWLAVALGAVFLIYVALEIYLRYGTADITQAETMIYGMLLFFGGIVLLAALTVLLAKLIGRLARRGGKSPFHSRGE